MKEANKTTPEAIKRVASMANISEHYINAMGEETDVSAATVEYLLSSLGYDVSNDKALLKSAEKKHKKPVLQSMLVLTDDEDVHVDLHLGASARESEFSWRLETEEGDVLEGYLQSQIVSDRRKAGGPLTFSLPNNLPWGYHKLTLTRKRRKAPYEMTLVIAPKSCYKQEPLQCDEKMWGPSIQLYTLRTSHNWGMGDFGDLKQLVGEVAERGGDFIGLNPIHSLFPANPEGASPYSPSSRRWLNILYIDVSSVPEFALSKEAQARVGSSEFQQRLHQARESHWVNYSEVSALKMSVLPTLYQEFKRRHLDNNTDRASEFMRFVDNGGQSLLQQATFDALHAHLREQYDDIWGWPVFPEKYQKYHSPSVRKFIVDEEDSIQLHLYLQWIADSQIQEAQLLAEEKGMQIGLYRDLAVGVSDAGSETWADTGELCQDVSIGAPPDILGPLGQNWGLPPLNPQELQARSYKPFIDLIRANMNHCGALRIDHVLGLLRLWWVPKGQNASEGAYIYYPVKELLALLALESHRYKCSVIGEDLGTVPDEIVELLSDAGIHSYKVFFFEVAEDGGYYSPEHYSQQSMSALCTHDMPTLKGFWHCDDLKLGQELGLYPDEAQLNKLFDDRLRSKQEILNSVAWHGYLPEGIGRDAATVPMDRHLSEALQLHLAAGNSALFSVQLEDWLEMDNPVNIPGTVDEYPNWRRKLSVNLDNIFSNDNIHSLAEQLTALRKNRA
ncbi:4-alpha-glucanotransferase [Vibrio penaeicida]|uniref:4-alpha-glucanotransferase n=1 Tax=Vibrio penaeicida TaxID=104609 RepID=A0AAV5NV46_9VIBR|nr:4-alpha-glucanotransferase [Vibrio penaeicida]RTZ24038.1 4-alpha-glucanotransferase [Vibrio penaeicida]GLQ74204.1 4-alpha-glucanotransferase [Vibrio penaeicida]